MAEKAKRGKKSNKNIMAWVGGCVIVVAIVAAVVALVALMPAKINDSYFVSDDHKYVMNFDEGEFAVDDAEHAPAKTHIVYEYSGDDVTSMKAYYEYENGEKAQAAYDAMFKDMDEEAYSEAKVDGKYVILTANESEYKDLTATDVKRQIEFLETLKNMELDSEPTEEVDVTVTDDTAPAGEEVEASATVEVGE